MARSVTALKNVLKREESLLVTLTKALALMSHKDSKAAVRKMITTKRNDIKEY